MKTQLRAAIALLAMFMCSELTAGERPPQYPTLTVTTWTITEQPRVGEIVTEALVPAQVTTTEKRGPFGRVREKSTTIVQPTVVQQRTPVVQTRQVMQVHEVGACGAGGTCGTSMGGRPAAMRMSAPRTFRSGGG